jgi:hypothetical protein
MLKTQLKPRVSFVAGLVLCLSLLAIYSGHTAPADVRFEISYPSSLDTGPITGRIFVVVSKTDRIEPRLQAGSYYGGSVPFFGRDVHELKPGDNAVISARLCFCRRVTSRTRAGSIR